MSWQGKTQDGEPPYWPAGPFKIRLPFIHYRFEWPDYFQGLLMCAVDLGAIALMTSLLGMSFEVALAVVILNGFLYLTHHLLGDPVVPGWITPAIPLLIAFCESFPEGTDRVHALIAFQFMLGVLSIGLGVSGLAYKVVRYVPPALRAGIIIGAGFAAVKAVVEDGGEFDNFPWTISICVGLAFYVIFSRHFSALKQRGGVWGLVGQLGILPIIALAVIVAPIFAEAPWPNIEWGLSNPDFIGLWSGYTLFGLGLPPASFFLTSLPTVAAAYIVLFGDVLQSEALLDDAEAARPDSEIDYNPNRAHMIFGGRNAVMSVIGPDVAMCGPLWAAMHVVICERYKEGKRAMASIVGGAGSFRWGSITGLLLLPIVSLVEPIISVALALTLLIQGYVSVRVGVLEARSQRDLGIAGIIAAILAIKGAAWAFGVGVILCLLIYNTRFFTGENDETFAKDETSGPAE